MRWQKAGLWMFVCAALLAVAPPLPTVAGEAGEEGIELYDTGWGSWYSSSPRGTETTTEYTSTAPLPVPDNACSSGWVTSVITVPDSYYVADVNVGVWMTHTYRGDVEMQLRAPDGTTVLLIADLGAGADNINALFDDSAPAGPDSVNHTAPPPYYTDHPWRPLQALAAFRGVPLAGDWSLDVCDDAGGDTGTLEQWSLFVETDVVVLDPPVQGATACPDDIVTYGLEVLNGTVTTQPFTLSYTGNAWPVSGPATTANLPTGGSEVISFSHQVPAAAQTGDIDTVTVTATGTVVSAATATTEVPLVVGWGDLASLTPTGRPVRNHSVVYAGGKLYKIGGYDGAAQAYLDIYDIATDTWSTGADMPAARYYIDCVEIGGKIYCAGGYTTSGQDDLYIYDIATDAWSTGALMPANRYHYAGVALGGKYYVIGGYTTGYLATTVVYDPLTDTWDSTTVPNMGVARRYHSAGVIGGKIYVAGGYNGSYLSSAEVYDPVGGSWSPIASIPTAWLHAADAVLSDRFMVLGGGASSSTAAASNGAWIYDADTDRWSLSIMNHLLYGSEADSDGSTFWIASGRGYDGAYLYSPWTIRAYTCGDRTDLSVTKDDGVTGVIPGDSVFYIIEATNNGSAAVQGALVQDQFPPALTGVTWTCVATGGGSCTSAGTGDIDDVVALGPGESATYYASGIVDPGATGTLDNTASVWFGTVPDLTPWDNEATDSDLLTPEADLVITKDDGVTDVGRGEILTYTISVTNTGLSHAPGATVTDIFPNLLNAVSWTCVGSGGGTCTASGSGNIADIVDLPVGASVVYSATGEVDTLAPHGSLTNTANVTPPPGVADPDPTDNSATDVDVIVVVADLAITKDDGVDEVAPGDPITYTIAVTNNGPDLSNGALVTDAFPAAIVGVTWTCVASGGASCTPAGSGNIADVVNLPVGGSLTYSAAGTVSPSATGTIVNTATVTAVDATDPVPANNSATDSDTVLEEQLPFTDGFESGDTSAWSATMP